VVAAEAAAAFGAALRHHGLTVPSGALVRWLDAVDVLDPLRRDHLYWAGRLTLVTRPEDLDAYDRAFAACWADAPPAPPGADRGSGEDEPDDADAGIEGPRYSRRERLRTRDFAGCTPAEIEETYRLIAGLRVAGPRRRSRRWRPTSRARGRPDVRGTMRASLRTGGEPVRRTWLARAERPRPIVLLCDVSGSMDPYARALVRFLHVAVVAGRRVEAFALGTRLTRLTRELSSRDPDRAVSRAAASVTDWSGGTRLGDGLRTFNDDWGVRGTARGAVVVILSDGWDRGDPAVMSAEMARLARVAHRTVWVNPLKATPGYEPLSRGMAAALPHVDEFVEGHNVAALEHLVEVIA
jgi:uncharacterized protein with von Willebrand factor type A (vWA) domain